MNIERVVVDTNIWIDLINSELLSAFCDLPWEIRTNNFVIEEIKEPEEIEFVKSFIDSKKIKVITYTSEEITKIAAMFAATRGLSFADCSVWFEAKRFNALLLTGDSRLRSIVQKDSIEVSGLLFVFDNLKKSGFPNSKMLADKLKTLLSINKRLPEKECKQRIVEWSK